MKNNPLATMLAVALALTIPMSQLAAAPNTISYNGKLVGKDGAPLKGVQLMEFSICDALTGGTCPWKEQRSVTFTNGTFSIQLGDVTALPASIFENKELYLGVALFTSGTDWEVFAPRKRMAAAPFAMNANDVLEKDITPRSVSIKGYGLVIDSQGKWVGSTVGIQGVAGPQGPAGPAGPSGSKGDPGQTSLIALVEEPAGANCTNGGKKVVVGLDKNGNNSLDADEGTSSAYVCNATSATGGVPVVMKKSNLAYGWTQTFGGSSSDDVKGVATDNAGNLYVTGNFSGAVDGQTAFGNVDVFIRKYSATGELLWSRSFGGNNKDLVSAIAVEPISGKVYIGGVSNVPTSGPALLYFSYGSASSIGIVSTPSNSPRVPYILHLSTNGDYSWAKTITSVTAKGEAGITDLVIDEYSNVYYGGTYGSSLISSPIQYDFDPDPTKPWVEQSKGRADLFVSKLDQYGTHQWTYTAGAVGNFMTAARIQVKAGTVYVLGKDRSYDKFFITKLDATSRAKLGEATWAASNFPYLAPTSIAVDSVGAVLVTAIGSIYNFGTSSNSNDRYLLRTLLGGRSIFPSIANSFSIIQKFDATLKPLWTQTQGSFGSNGIYGVALDANDNVYVGGEYTGGLLNAGFNYYDPRTSVGGSTDLNLTKVSSTGEIQWAETIGGYGGDRLQSLRIVGNSIYLGGFVTGGMDGDFTRATRQYITSKGAEDAYVSKFTGIVTP